MRAKAGAGSPDLVIESLPLRQKDEEYAILEKFLGSLRHFERRDIAGDFRRGDDWPDFETGEGADALGIELTWVTYEPHDDLRRCQQQYAQRVSQLLADAGSQLAGVHFQLENGYQDPRYPRLGSLQGEAVAKATAELIRSSAAEFADLPV
jgi:hypothetical protein